MASLVEATQLVENCDASKSPMSGGWGGEKDSKTLDNYRLVTLSEAPILINDGCRDRAELSQIGQRVPSLCCCSNQ